MTETFGGFTDIMKTYKAINLTVQLNIRPTEILKETD